MATYEWKDRGLAKFLRNIAYLEQTNVRAGIVGGAEDQPAGTGGMSVGEVALINEFGTGHVPRRSFIRKAITTPKAHELARFLAESALYFNNFGNMDPAFHAAGEGLVEIMRQIVMEGSTKQNAPATVVRKGFDHPLVDSGTLLGAIGYELVRSGGAVLASLPHEE
jgi:hypothetical protein